MIRIFFLSQSSPILELFPFDKITLKSYICTVVTVMAKQCWSQTVLESGSWGHSVLQTPALVQFCVTFCCFCFHSPQFFLKILGKKVCFQFSESFTTTHAWIYFIFGMIIDINANFYLALPPPLLMT